jgi:hypothetical protein
VLTQVRRGTQIRVQTEPSSPPGVTLAQAGAGSTTEVVR